MSAENSAEVDRKLRHLLARVDDSEISSIKSIVSELIRLINDPESHARELKEVIEKDPLLSAKLLKLANSAYYGFPNTISDIQEAIVCVGFDSLRELALSQQLHQLFDDNDIIAGYSRALLWKHSVAVANFGKVFYRDVFGEKSGNIYVAGLVHDIGIIIEEQFLMNEFFQILDEANSSAKSLVDIESEILGYDHTDIGRAVAMDWNFPIELADAIGNHHALERMKEERSKVVATLFIADYLCHKEGIGYSYAAGQDQEAFEASRDMLVRTGDVKLDDEILTDMMAEVLDKIAQMESAGWF